MPNRNKEKGTRWEREAVEILNKNFPGAWKRIPGSGAMGTILDIPALKGDLVGAYSCFPQRFVAEAKVGYGGSQMTVSKEWFDKISAEALQNYSLPLVLLKFEKSRGGVRHVVAMDIETWDKLVMYVTELKDELNKLYEKV